jgi:hypothetical protein
MRVIPVTTYPLKATYDSFAAAIAAAKADPLQPKAQSDSARLARAMVVDARWTDTDFVIEFSNTLFLHVYVHGEEVDWNVADTPPALDVSAVERAGDPAVMIRWGPEVGDEILDRSDLVSRRRGSEFRLLFVSGPAFLVYCRGHRILWFQAVHRTDLDQSMLWVTEED